MSTITTAPPVDKESNPWESQRARFDLAAQKLNLDEGLWRVLRYPNRELTVYIPVQMDDGHLEVFTGFRVQHSIARGPAKGGIRYAPDVNTNEQIMAWMMDTYSMHMRQTVTAVVTGKPINIGGSRGRREATGRGVMIICDEALKKFK